NAAETAAATVTLEETLRNFDFVARPESNALGGVFAKALHIVNRGFVATEKADVPLIGEIVKTARSVDRRQQSHVFSKWDAGRIANRTANVHEAGARLHEDGDVGV